MARLSRSSPGVTGVVAVVSAMALGAWEADRVADRLGPGSERGAGATRLVASRQPVRPARAGPLAVDEAEPSGLEEQPAARDPERDAAEQLSGSFGRLARDLEYSRGLAEPLQQVVVPPPPPWTPDRSARTAPPPVIDEVSPSQAPAAGGTAVTLRGRNLRALQVMFGPVPARIVGASADAVTVIAPPARAGEVAVALTNGDGSYDIAALPFTYLP
jgi:hypothetical protein